MLLMRSMGMMRSAPKKGLDSPKVTEPAAATADGEVLAVAMPGIAELGELVAPPPLPPPLTKRNAASTSLTDACLSGNTPTDMPLSKSTSKVLTKSIQPSAWVRVPIMTSRLRTVSTRTMASDETMGRKMEAISPAPMYCSGMMTAP